MHMEIIPKNGFKPRQNRLLAALSKADSDRLFPHLESVRLPLGKVLYESGDSPDYVFFPTSGIVSMLYFMENGASSEIAIVGNDGIVGISLSVGGESVPNRVVVQSEGHAYRLSGKILKQEFDRSGEFQHLLLRCTLVLLRQMSQTAFCNRHHSVDQQLCRWLLLSLDRLPSKELGMSQDLIADMLGIPREGVIEAVGKLQQAGLISCGRGVITVLDRPGIEARSCECYHVVKDESRRGLLPAFLS